MTFRLNPEGDFNLSSLQGYILVPPAAIAEKFKKYAEGGDKASRYYVFEDEQGRVFTVYDYKDTSIYDFDRPSPEEFWLNQEPIDLHIGGYSNPREFIEWLKSELGDDASENPLNNILG